MFFIIIRRYYYEKFAKVNVLPSDSQHGLTADGGNGDEVNEGLSEKVPAFRKKMLWKVGIDETGVKFGKIIVGERVIIFWSGGNGRYLINGLTSGFEEVPELSDVFSDGILRETSESEPIGESGVIRFTVLCGVICGGGVFSFCASASGRIKESGEHD